MSEAYLKFMMEIAAIWPIYKVEQRNYKGEVDPNIMAVSFKSGHTFYVQMEIYDTLDLVTPDKLASQLSALKLENEKLQSTSRDIVIKYLLNVVKEQSIPEFEANVEAARKFCFDKRIKGA